MNTDMVMFAKGQPTSKSREMEGQMPFEEWIYGTPPEEVDFVRINGNRVIRVEIARDGQPLAIFTKDVVSPMLMAAGSPELAETKTHIIKEGDVETDPNKQEAAPPPSLRNPGETLPTDNTSVGRDAPRAVPQAASDEHARRRSRRAVQHPAGNRAASQRAAQRTAQRDHRATRSVQHRASRPSQAAAPSRIESVGIDAHNQRRHELARKRSEANR